MCFGCSKEPSHGSFEYPQHMFWFRNKKIIFSYTLLSGGLIGACGLIRLNMLVGVVSIHPTSGGSGVGA